MLTVLNLNTSLEDKKILRNISFSIKNNMILGICGNNGSGKSTLLKSILGFYEINKQLAPESQILFSSDIKMSYVPQTPSEFLLPWKNCLNNLKINYPSFSKEQLLSHLSIYGINKGLEKRYPFELSGGFLQRLAWACAILPGKELVLLDEPFSKQDRKNSKKMTSVLRDFISVSGRSAILVSHDPQLLIKCSDRILILTNDRESQNSIKDDINVNLNFEERTNFNITHENLMKSLQSVYL